MRETDLRAERMRRQPQGMARAWHTAGVQGALCPHRAGEARRRPGYGKVSPEDVSEWEQMARERSPQGPLGTRGPSPV